MYRLCFGTVMTILYQARNQKVTNDSICDAFFSALENQLIRMMVLLQDI